MSEEEGFEDSFAELALLSRDTNPLKKPLFSSLKVKTSDLLSKSSLWLKLAKQKSENQHSEVKNDEEKRRSPLSSFENMRKGMVKIMPKIKMEGDMAEKPAINNPEESALE